MASTIVEYSLAGAAVKTWSVPGHADGLRVNPGDHRVWVTSNEDAAPLLNVIDPSRATPTNYALAPTAHGGGYDDLAFVNGGLRRVLEPHARRQRQQRVPSDRQADALRDQCQRRAGVDGQCGCDRRGQRRSPTTLNLTDPNSFTIDPKGNLVLVSQADSALITIQNPGTPGQPVTKTPVGNQQDDTIYTTSNSGRLFVVDAGKNAIYTVRWSGPKGTVFSEAPNNSGVVGFVGTIDMTTGFITPLITGWTKPTGLIFVPGN